MHSLTLFFERHLFSLVNLFTFNHANLLKPSHELSHLSLRCVYNLWDFCFLLERLFQYFRDASRKKLLFFFLINLFSFASTASSYDHQPGRGMQSSAHDLHYHFWLARVLSREPHPAGVWRNLWRDFGWVRDRWWYFAAAANSDDDGEWKESANTSGN